MRCHDFGKNVERHLDKGPLSFSPHVIFDVDASLGTYKKSWYRYQVHASGTDRRYLVPGGRYQVPGTRY